MAKPVRHRRPVLRPVQHNRKVQDLARLDQRERFEQLVHRAVAAGKDDEAFRVLGEHRLADEEVVELERKIDVGVEALLCREIDVAPDR